MRKLRPSTARVSQSGFLGESRYSRVVSSAGLEKTDTNVAGAQSFGSEMSARRNWLRNVHAALKLIELSIRLSCSCGTLRKAERALTFAWRTQL